MPIPYTVMSVIHLPSTDKLSKTSLTLIRCCVDGNIITIIVSVWPGQNYPRWVSECKLNSDCQWSLLHAWICKHLQTNTMLTDLIYPIADIYFILIATYQLLTCEIIFGSKVTHSGKSNRVPMSLHKQKIRDQWEILLSEVRDACTVGNSQRLPFFLHV